MVAAAVCLPPPPWPKPLDRLDDSKKLTPATRAAVAPAVARAAWAVGLGIVGPDVIDEINILEATRRAMRIAIARALARLGRDDAVLLVDGHLPLPGWAGEQWPIVKGDSKSHHIAAGSVVAKVARDRWMALYGARYPGYGFERHMGYGTLEHRRALAALGPCPIHRRSFRWKPPP